MEARLEQSSCQPAVCCRGESEGGVRVEEEEECKTSWRPVPLLLHSTDPGALAPPFEVAWTQILLVNPTI